MKSENKTKKKNEKQTLDFHSTQNTETTSPFKRAPDALLGDSSTTLLYPIATLWQSGHLASQPGGSDGI